MLLDCNALQLIASAGYGLLEIEITLSAAVSAYPLFIKLSTKIW
jgi:hypothetical protein